MASEKNPASIRITLTFPGDASEDEVRELSRKFALRLDTLYRSLGGSGLKVEEIDDGKP